MLDRRPFWGLIIWLNLCVVIWLVTVQEPVMPEAEGAAASALALTAVTSSIPPPHNAAVLLKVTQQQPSANVSASKPNQKRDSSRIQRSNLSHNDSIVSLNTAAKAAHSLTTMTPTLAHSSPPTSVPVNTDPFAATDAKQLIDLHNFAYIMSQPPCEAHTQALILVHTAPHNAEKRALIRQTWASPLSVTSSPLRLVFLLGAVLDNPPLQLALAQENARHADMVQGNFRDAYRNMTYKHVMALKWFHNNCAQAQMLLKVDDDVYVNTPQLLKTLQPAASPQPALQTNMTTTSLHSLLQQPHELLFCMQFIGARVKRTWRSKWRVSFNEYSDRYYPPYCPGFAILYSPDVVERLYHAAQRSRYFWVDDVHITGVLAQRTNTSITMLQPYILHAAECERLLAGHTDMEQLEFLVSWHSISPQQISGLWQMYSTQNYTLTSRPELAIKSSIR